MNRPLPRPNADSKPFWDGCAAGELQYQACSHCGQVQVFPRALCSSCHQGGLQWKTSARRGRVLSHTRVQRAPSAAFREEVPYIIALVEMDEGFRLMVNVKDCAPVEIGQEVRIGFRLVEGVALPQAEVTA